MITQAYANDYCRKKACQSGSSFYYSFLFLDSQQKQAIFALYAFCREVDDIVDECTSKDIAEKKLGFWAAEIDRIFMGNPQHPLGFALLEALQYYPLQKSYFLEILAGMTMDLHYQGYDNFTDLEQYCFRVASCVGLLATEIFGFQNKATLEFARNLGLALQLVNIIRDVGEDANRNRIYIPEAELKIFGLGPEDILKKDYTDNFQSLMQFQAKRAREYYDRAKTSLAAIDRQAQRSSLIMAEIYFCLLTEIEKGGFQVLHQRNRLTPLRKLYIAWKTSRQIKKYEK